MRTVGQIPTYPNLSRTDEAARPDLRPVGFGEVLLWGALALPVIILLFARLARKLGLRRSTAQALVALVLLCSVPVIIVIFLLALF